MGLAAPTTVKVARLDSWMWSTTAFARTLATTVSSRRSSGLSGEGVWTMARKARVSCCAAALGVTVTSLFISTVTPLGTRMATTPWA